MNTFAVKDLLFRLADDDLIIGHRNSEWTGAGPILEEDIAFASMAQDQVGHAQAYYELLHAAGEDVPDKLAFQREPNTFLSCQFVEQPIGDYAFSLMRHFLYDHAKFVRLRNLSESSSYEELRGLAGRIAREVKYHVLHGKTWITQLGNGSDEGRLRMQTALNEAWPMAFGIFETTEYTEALAEEHVMKTEAQLREEWLEVVSPILETSGLKIPEEYDVSQYEGGRKGYHSEYLEPLLKEMTEVVAIDPTAVW